VCLLYTPDYFLYKEVFFYCTRRTTSVISRFYCTHPSTSVTKYVAPQIKQNTISERICVDTNSDTKRDAWRLGGVQPLYGAGNPHCLITLITNHSRAVPYVWNSQLSHSL